jgi:DNA oxidative demethylase
MDDLLIDVRGSGMETETSAEGAMLFRGFVGQAEALSIVATVRQIADIAPFRHIITPGGHRMSVARTNCGRVGWTTDRTGYRYDPVDSETRRPWPPMPEMFRELAERAANAAGFPGFEPDSCLINRYEPDAKLSLHQDKNEESYDAHIVSVWLGLPATFLFGGLLRRTPPPRRFRLESGDVVVWGGPARLAHHGVDPLPGGDHPPNRRMSL